MEQKNKKHLSVMNQDYSIRYEAARLNRHILTALAVFLCLCSASLFAADANTKIGYVDIPYLIDKAPQAVAAAKRLELEFAPRQSEIKKQRKELNDIKLEIEDGGLDMKESQLSKLRRESRKLERRLKRDEQEFREELNIQKNTEFKKIRVSVLDAISKFGKSNKYSLILSDGVLYADEGVDLTEKILQELRSVDKSNISNR